MKEPQNRPRNHNPIMPPLRRILHPPQLPPIPHRINTPRPYPQLHLPPHHPLIEPQMPLRGKQPPPNVHALDLGRRAAAPDVDVAVVLFGEEHGGARGGRVQDVVLVHLVQVDGVGRGVVEELGADGGDGDGRVGELPFAVGGGADGGAEGAAADLVAEADAAEADVGAVLPEG